ncbi:MAG: shikimate kinase [Verrucomicrobiae bacterium]|nr:shikimate kinase [Verrucomicrobiae bacterium]
MGTGKSTIGRQLAHHLQFHFIDSDHAIEEKAGLPISQIFSQQGEPAFRAMEREFIESGHPSESCVISCGGGLVMQPGLKEIMQERGLVVSLFASPETIYERVRHNKHRPLLNVENPLDEIQRLLEERLPVYREAGVGVLTDGRTVADIVAHILRIYSRGN